MSRKRERLNEAFRALLKEADVELRPILNEGKIPTAIETRAQLVMSKLIGFGKRRVPRLGGAASSILMRLNQGRIYREFQEALEDLPGLKRHSEQPFGNGFECTTISISHLCQQMLMEYLRRKRSFRIDARKVESITKRVQDHFSSRQLTTHFRAYLENIELGTKVISLGEGVKVKSLSVVDVVGEYNSSKYFRQFYDGRWRDHVDRTIKAVVVVELTAKKEFGEASTGVPLAEQAIGESSVWMVLDALRIVAGGEINRSPMVVTTEFYPFENQALTVGRNDFRAYTGMPKLERSQNASLRRVYSGLTSEQASLPVMSIVLKRLHYANNPRNSEDRILDICMGLEALVKGRLAKGTDIRTNSKIVGLYIADLVARTRKERREKFRIIQAGYIVRNKVAHGSSPDPKDDDVVRDMFYLFRLSLYHVITGGPQLVKKSIADLIP